MQQPQQQQQAQDGTNNAFNWSSAGANLTSTLSPSKSTEATAVSGGATTNGFGGPTTPTRAYRKPPAHLTDRRKRVEDALRGYKSRRELALNRARGMSDSAVPTLNISTVSAGPGLGTQSAGVTPSHEMTDPLPTTPSALHPSQRALSSQGLLRAIGDDSIEDEEYLRVLQQKDLEDRRARESALASEASQYASYSAGVGTPSSYGWEDEELSDDEDEDFFFALSQARYASSREQEEAAEVARLERELARIERLERAWERHATENFVNASEGALQQPQRPPPLGLSPAHFQALQTATGTTSPGGMSRSASEDGVNYFDALATPTGEVEQKMLDDMMSAAEAQFRARQSVQTLQPQQHEQDQGQGDIDMAD
ncbi:hypothetical protein PYCC9005_001344 [Savitreella phatthalungensis]